MRTGLGWLGIAFFLSSTTTERPPPNVDHRRQRTTDNHHLWHHRDRERERKRERELRAANAPLVNLSDADLLLSSENSGRRCNSKGRGSIYNPVLGICCHFCSSICLRKRKMPPTGIAVFKAREMGYKSVAHLLMEELKLGKCK